MQGRNLIIISIIIIVLIVFSIIIHLIRKKKFNNYKKILKDLEVKRNLIESTPVLLELSKVEPIIKNDRMEEKYNDWQDRFNKIKEDKLSKIDDMLLELDSNIMKRNYKLCDKKIAISEAEIYKLREQALRLLDEIKDITLSEEKYRSIVIKLKTKYRELNKEFNDNRNLYDNLSNEVMLQLENIEKKFLDFEKVMDSNDYQEVVHIVKAIDVMIEHMEIVIKELPDILLMINQILPNRMKEVKKSNDDMIKEGYPLEYLNIDYNLEESKKMIETIFSKVKMLNLEGVMFDLKTMLEYFDSLFIDFEKERLSKKVYEEMKEDFKNKIDNTNNLVNDVYGQLDDIKNMYDLKEEDIDVIHKANKTLVVINDDYKKMLSMDEKKSTPYSKLNNEIEKLSIRLLNMENDFDLAMSSLGNMHADEERAKEQLDEIDKFLKQSKMMIRGYKLPVIDNNYYVQLEEANEAIREVVNELNKKPIVIKILNTRVDTARDLVLKLYSTTSELVKVAQMAEMAICYGNRYRSKFNEIDNGLEDAEASFKKGRYKEALDISVKSCEIVDKDIYRKLLELYDK